MRPAALLSLVFLSLAAEEPLHDMGPFPTREMFPMFLPTMAYQPVDPQPMGRGRWRWSLNWIEANTFQFSDVFERHRPVDTQGRIAVTRPFVEAHLPEYAALPMVYFFDEEIARFELQGRYGLTDRTDLWFFLPVQNHTGGFLDPLIEDFHRIGFEQFGRTLVMQNQVTLAMAQNGKLVFFSDERLLGKAQDPVLGMTHELIRAQDLILSWAFSLKPPLTRTYDVYRSGWDTSFGLTGMWQPAGRHRFYGGTSYVHRPNGSRDYTDIGFKDGVGAHATWEYRKWRKVQPYLQLYWQSGYLHAQLGHHFDHPSLQHDLGVHWHWTPRTTLSFRYMNNITHNGNTADMGLGASLTASF